MRFVFAGGGTGGHLAPGASVAADLVARDPAHEVVFVTGGRRVEERLLRQHSFRRFRIDAVPFPGRPRDLIQFLLGTTRAVRKSLALLKRVRPAVVVGLGGYGSFGPVTTAALTGTPCAILEQNSVPGRANRVLSLVADRAFVQFASSRKRFARPHHCRVVGNPVRAEILAAARADSSPPDGLSAGAFTLLVLGGSQGCRAINEALVKIAAQLVHRCGRLQVIHQSGPYVQRELAEAYAAAGAAAWVCEFIEDMGRVYAWADLVVGRAGATTIAELAVRGLPAALVPLPGAMDNHQFHNAYALETAGACRIVEQRPGFETELAEAVCALALDSAARDRMARAMKSFGRPDAARLVADGIMELARGSTR